MNNQVVVNINDACHLFEYVFRDGVSEELFELLSELNRILGYDVGYGVNTCRGGLDKGVVQIHYNKAKETQDAAKIIESALQALGFQFILWKRDIDYGALKSNILEEIFDKESEKQVTDNAKADMEKAAYHVANALRITELVYGKR